MSKIRKRIIGLLFIATMLIGIMSPMTICSAVNEPAWKTLYREKLKSVSLDVFSVETLVDINSDGTPELLIGEQGGSSYYAGVTYAYTVCDGKLINIFSKEAYVDIIQMNEAKLYYNPTTNQFRILSFSSEASGANYREDSIVTYTLANNILTQTNIITKICSTDWKTNKTTYSYKAYNKAVSETAYNQVKAELYNGWQEIPQFGVAYAKISSYDYSDINSFLNSYSSSLTISQSITAIPSKSSVLVNGTYIAFQAYNINANNYFKLRDIAKVLSGTGNQFEVGWDGVNNAIALTTGLVYTPVGGELTTSGGNTNTAATSSTSKVYINGSMVSLTAYTIGGNNYFKLRDIGMAIGFSVDWDSANNSIKIGTTATSVNTPSSDNGKKMQIIYSGSGDEIDNLSQYVNSVLYHAEGFQFPASTEKYNGKYVVPYLCFTADNSNRAYEMLTFFAATDDRSTNKGNVLYVGTTTDGYVFDWKNFNVWDASQDIKLQSDCFTKYKFNFANFNKVTVYLVPATTTNDYYFEDGKILSTGQALETSMVMNGAFLK